MELIEGEGSRGRSDNCTGGSAYKPMGKVGIVPDFL